MDNIANATIATIDILVTLSPNERIISALESPDIARAQQIFCWQAARFPEGKRPAMENSLNLKYGQSYESNGDEMVNKCSRNHSSRSLTIVMRFPF
jgi:hypothetical protein